MAPSVETPAPPAEEKKNVVGFIYPPPEVRNIVDKTANFVARNGPEFEARIRQNEQNNAKFNFLSPGDPYHAYYQHRVNECRTGKAGEKDVSAPASVGLPRPGVQMTVSTQQQQKQQELLRSAVQELVVPKEPPPEFEFIADPPSISAFDLDVVRLTAQFVARNGRQFLTTLMYKEQRNNQFDFLRPQHSLFQYFTRLLEQYTKILIPPKDLMKRLSLEANSPAAVMKQVQQRVDWEKHQCAMKRKEEEEEERERMEYAAIDWHDFSVVETIDYQPWEVGSFPPPTTPQEVGRRVLLQERIDEGVNPDTDMVLDSDEEEGPENVIAMGDRDDTQVQDMEEESSSDSSSDSEEDDDDEDSDDEDDRTRPPPPPPTDVNMEEDDDEDGILVPPLPKEPPQPTPAPPTPGQAVVRDYDPRAKLPATSKSEDQYLVSPITGEKISADKIQSHLKISTLDPRWTENRERQRAETARQDVVYAPGESILSSLKELAGRRTDIFGAGNEETGIGKKIGEEEDKREEKVTWDGHTASMEAATRAARANISINEQIHQIHKVKGLLPDQEKEKIGPQPKTAGKQPPPPSMKQQQPPPPPPPKQAPKPQPPPPPPPKQQPPVPLPPPKLAPQPVVQPGQQMMRMPIGGPMAPMAQMIPTGGMMMVQQQPVMMAARTSFIPGQPVAGFMTAPQPPQPPGMVGKDDDDEGPAAKRARTEENLVSEDEWKQRHPSGVKFQVAVPIVNDKPEWRLNGQTLTITLPVSDPVSVVKAQLHAETGVPPGKQKLLRDGLFFKDSHTLAFYNIGPGTLIQFQLKERGGRKK